MLKPIPYSDDMDRFLFRAETGRTTDIRLGALYSAVVFTVLVILPLPKIDICINKTQCYYLTRTSSIFIKKVKYNNNFTPQSYDCSERKFSVSV